MGKSTSDHLRTSLAAEASLEEFDGPKADAQLARCVRGWQIDAYVRAGRALLKRNKPLLRKTLRESSLPNNGGAWNGILMAECGDPHAVPVLAEAVGRFFMLSGQMFNHIERLATKDHVELLRALPGKVRPGQRKQAESVVKAVLERLKKEK